ncbi:MAG: hypothetical protein AB9866_25110 [Syntrophobacteraceae bacterium]
MCDRKKSFEERMDAIPGLRERFEAILTLTEAEGNGLKTADEAEQRTIEEVRKLGNEVLHAWARTKESLSAAKLTQEGLELTRHGKKKSTGTRHSDK